MFYQRYFGQRHLNGSRQANAAIASPGCRSRADWSLACWIGRPFAMMRWQGSPDVQASPGPAPGPAIRRHTVRAAFTRRNRPTLGSGEDSRKTDSGLTTQLLKHVNSAYRGVRQKIGSVAQALSLLGCQQSRHFVIATGMEAAIRAHGSKLINQNSFWNTNLRRAIFSRHVALLMRTDPEIAFLGALLQDYLLPVLTNDLCDVYREFLQSPNEDGASLSDFERAHFGWDHTLVGPAWPMNGIFRTN